MYPDYLPVVDYRLVVLIAVISLTSGHRLESGSLVTALQKSKAFQWPINSYVQVRRANLVKKLRVPRADRKPQLRRVIENAKITTIWIDDGYRDRTFERHRNEAFCFGELSSNGCTRPFIADRQSKAFELDGYFMGLSSGGNRVKRSTRKRYLVPKFRKKHGVLSEVYYKDEMSRNQQIDVYDDIRKHFESPKRPKFRLMELIVNQLDEKSTKSSKASKPTKKKRKRGRDTEILGLEPPSPQIEFPSLVLMQRKKRVPKLVTTTIF